MSHDSEPDVIAATARELAIDNLEAQLYKECYTGHQGDAYWRKLAEWVYDYGERQKITIVLNTWGVLRGGKKSE